MHKRVGVLVVAHNAAGTLAGTLDRIPAGFRDRIDEIIVLDDASGDETFRVGTDWARRNHPLCTTVLRHTKRLGYGGTRKAGCRLAIERGLDVVVLLPGHGGYAPESMPDLFQPLLADEADAVFGARTAATGGLRAKQVGDRVLTRFENRALGSPLGGFRSGYRAYSTAALREIPFEANSDGFDFDTQITVQLLHEGKRIVKAPFPGSRHAEHRDRHRTEARHVSGLSHAVGVARNLLEYRRVTLGIGTSGWVPAPKEDRRDRDGGTPDGALLAELAKLPAGRVLDLGCSGGRFAEQARALGHRVVGVDRTEIEGVRERLNLFVRADLNDGIPQEAHVAAGYDVVVAADVLQRLAHPDRLLREIRSVLRPGGQVLVRVPNGVHWYPRLRFASGRFDYDRRGILEAGNLRFFTRRSLRRMVASTGYDLLEEQVRGLPLRALGRSTRRGRLPAELLLGRVDRALARAMPNLFAYQLIARLTPHHQDTIGMPSLADEVFGARYGTAPGRVQPEGVDVWAVRSGVAEG